MSSLKLSPARTPKKLIGQLLIEAGLIAEPQLALALSDQKTSHYCNLRLGEILALRGWVSQQTSDFFVYRWHDILRDSKHKSNPAKIDKCLYLAGLITQKQIIEIAKRSDLKQTNIFNFFLQNP